MKSTLWGLLLIFLSIPLLPAQISDLQQVLIAVENENKDLKAFRENMKARELLWQATNNLSDPQLSAYYLPFGEHASPDYWEFEVTQTVEFPSVYAARSQWIKNKSEKQQLEYESLRRKKLLEATWDYYELVYYTHLVELYEQRINNATKALEHSQHLYEKGETGILEINKARLASLEPQFRLEEVQQSIQKKVIDLQYLCGCDDLSLDSFTYAISLQLAPLDSILSYAKTENMTLQMAEAEIQVASSDLDVAKSKKWPSLSAGFNYQGVPQNNYAGFYAGFNLPIWSQKHKVEAGQAALSASEVQLSALNKKIEDQLRKDYQAFQTKYRKYRIYKEAFNELDTEELLRQAYELGEFSFLNYYQEVQFYRNAKENLIQLEKELHQLKAKILQYEL